MTTHPLLAHIPPNEITGPLQQAIPAGEGVVTLIATERFGAYEVTAWRPVPQWEVDMLAAEFPGEPQPLAVAACSRVLQDDTGMQAAVSEAVDFLGGYLARVATSEAA